MKVRVIFEKSLREIVRDKVGLALTLLTAPIFVVFYALVFQPLEPARKTVAIDPNSGLESLLEADYTVVRSGDFEQDVRLRHVVFGVGMDGDGFRIVGDGTSPDFVSGLPALQTRLQGFEAKRRKQDPIAVRVETVGLSGERSQFDLYVPNLLIFALIMLVFSSALPIAREVERGTMDRLRTTMLEPWQYLLGMTAAQLAVGMVSVALTLGVASFFGFEAAGSMGLVVAIALTTGVSCVSLGVLVAAAARNGLQAFLVSSVFMFLLVLFSGLVFPVPDLVALELLPTVHAIDALSAVLNLGASFDDVRIPLAKLAGLSFGFYFLGWMRFARLHRNRLVSRT